MSTPPPPLAQLELELLYLSGGRGGERAEDHGPRRREARQVLAREGDELIRRHRHAGAQLDERAGRLTLRLFQPRAG